MNMTAGEVATLVGGVVVGDHKARLSGVSGIREAKESDLTFLADTKYLGHLATTKAGAVLVPKSVSQAACPLIQVDDPRLALFMILKMLEAEQAWRPSGIHPSAVIGQNVRMGADVAIDANVCIGDGAVIGDGVTIHAGSIVGRGCAIGAQSILYQRVTLSAAAKVGKRCVLQPGCVIGAEGFGFAEQKGQQIKIPQVGTVILEDDVEVGANSCIDRATMGATVIGQGSKIDNLVQIGHNVQLGRNCIVCGNAGIAGSTILEDNVIIGAGAGIAGHIELGQRAMVAGYSGVTKSVKAGTTVLGFPAMEVERSRRVLAGVRQVPDALHRLKTLEQRLAQLEGTLDGTPKDDC